MTADRTTRALAQWLGVAAFVELTLLRAGTRTLIHIPGLGRFDVSIGVMTELGRFAYYMALVLVVSSLLVVGWRCWATRRIPDRIVAVCAWSFIVLALLGRLGVVPGTAVALVSLTLMVMVLFATWSGLRSLPVTLFVAASGFAWWSVFGQTAGGGLAGQTVDVMVVVAEALFLLAGASAPLLVRGQTTKSALLAGLATTVVVTVGFSVGGSTLAILALWNLGVPGWFPPIAYGIALGGLVFSLWSAIAKGMTLTASAVLLMVAGGVGPISTYQTALALTAVVLVGVADPGARRSQPADWMEPRADVWPLATDNLVPRS